MTTTNVSATTNRKTTISHRSWKNIVQTQQLVTSVPKKEQAIVIIMLESVDNNAKAEKDVCKFTAAKLNTDEGMTLLILKLDSIFDSDTTDEA